MSTALDRLWQESMARVYARAVELVEANDDWLLDVCVQLAMMEEALLHGIPSATTPIGITRVSPNEHRSRRP